MSSLEAGEWGPGDAIPCELSWRCAGGESGTVRKAIDEMAAEISCAPSGQGHFRRHPTTPVPSSVFCASFPTSSSSSNPTANPSNAAKARCASVRMARVLGPVWQAHHFISVRCC